MSDQYLSTNERALAYGTTMRPEPLQPLMRQDSGGGLGAGLLVASVFVIVAILAAVVFSNPEMFAPRATVVEPVPATVIDNSAVTPAVPEVVSPVPTGDQPAAPAVAP